ncbi:MAG: hypothetical protein ACOCXQ_02050 [Patescibacteria group bacterium]
MPKEKSNIRSKKNILIFSLIMVIVILGFALYIQTNSQNSRASEVAFEGETNAYTIDQVESNWCTEHDVSYTAWYPFFAGGWPMKNAQYHQWTNVTIANPNDTDVSVTIVVRDSDDGSRVLHELTDIVPPKSSFDTRDIQETWFGFVDVRAGERGSMQIFADLPVQATTRTFITSSTDPQAYNGEVIYYEDEPFIDQASTTIFAIPYSNYTAPSVKFKQKDAFFVANTSNRSTMATATVHYMSGETKEFKKLIEPYGTWQELDNTDTATVGYLTIEATEPLVGLNRQRKEDPTEQYVITQYDDEPFIPAEQASERLYYNAYYKAWPCEDFQGRECRLWSHPTMYNPGSQEAEVSIQIYDTEGALVNTLPITIPAYGTYNAHSSPSWNNMPSVPDKGISYGEGSGFGSMMIESSQPLIGQSRITHRLLPDNGEPNHWDDPAFLDDDTFVNPLQLSGYHSGPVLDQAAENNQLLITNPQSESIQVTITTYDTARNVQSISASIPGNGVWMSEADASWSSLFSTEDGMKIEIVELTEETGTAFYAMYATTVRSDAGELQLWDNDSDIVRSVATENVDQVAREYSCQ